MKISKNPDILDPVRPLQNGLAVMGPFQGETMKVLVPSVIFAFCLVGCEPSVSDIASKLQASMNEQFKNDAFYKSCNVTGATVSKNGGKYIGTAAIDYTNTSHSRIDKYQATVLITITGSKITWLMTPAIDSNGIASLSAMPLEGTISN
jgi:hypothetical protein